MPKVGEGWVEVTTRVDQTSLRNAQRQIEEAFDDFDVTIGVRLNTAELAEATSLLNSAFEGIVAEIGTAIDRASLATTVRTMDALLDAADINASVGTDINQASLARARAQISNSLRGIETTVRVNTDRSVFDRILGTSGGGDDGRRAWVRAGNEAGAGFVRGFLFQVANAFQLNGPIGGAVIVGLIAIVAAAAIPAGAMLGGLLSAAMVSSAGIGAAIVASVDSPEVAGAFDRLKQRFRDVFIDNENLDIISTKFAEIINLFTDAVLGTPIIKTVFGGAGENPFPPGTKAHSEWMGQFEMRGEEGGFPGLTPHFESILKRGMEFVQKFVEGIIGVLYILVPAFDDFVNSEFAMKIMENFAQGLALIAHAVAEGWQDILDDPAAQEGMIVGLQDFFKLARVLIGWAFDFIRWLSRTWKSIRTDEDGDGVTDFDKIMRWLGHIGVLFKVIGAFLSVFFAIWKTLVWDNPLFWEFMDQMDDFLDALARGLQGIADIIELAGSIWKNMGGGDDGEGGTANPGFFEDLGRRMQAAVDLIKQGGWSTIANWFKTNVWDKIPVGLSGALSTIGLGFSTALTVLKTGDWSTLSTWFVQNVWEKLPPGASRVLDTIGLLFSGTVSGIRTGDWSTLSGWFITNVWNKMPAPATTTLNLIGTLFNNAVNKVKSGGWKGLASWFKSNVLNPISSGFSSTFGGLPRIIEGVGPAVRAAIVNVVNGAIGKVRTAASVINALPFPYKIPLPNYIGYAEGGWVDGPMSMRDNRIAAVASGEFIVNARAAAQNGPLLEAINSGQSISGAPPIINVYVDGVQAAHRATVMDSHRRVIQHLGSRAYR